MDFVSKVDGLLRRHGFKHFGWTTLERPLSMAVYENWLEQGHHAGMAYLKEHAAAKADPRAHFAPARSAIVVAKPYLPHPYTGTSAAPPLPGLRKALYAQGEDYHLHFKEKLEEIAVALRMDWPDQKFLCFTDSAPILERDLAYRAGLGWIGKNTLLIQPRSGSLFFLGQILTSLDLKPAGTPMADACGTCRRCLDACPTGALEEPRRLNAGKCLAYWNIEAREAAPEPVRAKMSDWFFGCDICQTVCPWNEKHHGKDLMRALSAVRDEYVDRAQTVSDVRWLLQASHREIGRCLRSSPLLRARPLGLKRNALLVTAHLALTELRADVAKCLESPELKEVAQWTLAQLP